MKEVINKLKQQDFYDQLSQKDSFEKYYVIKCQRVFITHNYLENHYIRKQMDGFVIICKLSFRLAFKFDTFDEANQFIKMINLKRNRWQRIYKNFYLGYYNKYDNVCGRKVNFKDLNFKIHKVATILYD